jgi:hypothetical protein
MNLGIRPGKSNPERGPGRDVYRRDGNASVPGARSFEVGATSNMNRPLKQKRLEQDRLNLKRSCSKDRSMHFQPSWLAVEQAVVHGTFA